MKNNKNIILKYLPFFLAVFLLFQSCSGSEISDETVQQTEVPETTAAETLPTDTVLVQNGQAVYSIVRSERASDKVSRASVTLRNALESATGVKISISDDWFMGIVRGDYYDTPEYEILIGSTNRIQSSSALSSLDTDRYVIQKDGNKIVIAGDSDYSTVDAVNAFIETYLSGKTELSSLPYEILLEGERSTPLPKISDTVDAHIYLDELISDSTEELAAGIIYHKIKYVNSSGGPVMVYMAEIKKGAGILYCGTPDDGQIFMNKRATVTEEMKSAAANGKKVLLGVNADFFAIDSDYVPRGLAVKEGVLLRENTSRPFFAVLNDGSFKILESSQYNNYASKIVTAVGGSNILLNNGKTQSLDLTSDFGETRHPRTAVGYNRKDGTAYIMVVDGRQTAVSNGATLADLAWIFLTYGATDALNLDGGGSSTFVVRDTVRNTYSVKNSPSDGSQRKIADSLLVLLPE